MVKIHNRAHGTASPNAVNIMRPGPWGNPFAIGRDGSRKQVIAKYRRWLWGWASNDQQFKARLASLAGKDLVCCCAPLPCHGEVLARAATWAAKDLASKA